MIKKILNSILIAVFLLLLMPSPVLADTTDPDSVPTGEINVWRNSRQDGDWLIVIYANIPYGTPPTTPVTETFVWRLMHTDNVTELGSTVGTNYHDDGYGYNVYSMYFDAANATALGLTAGWGTVYPLRLSGNPVVFDTPPEYNYSINVATYSALTVQAEVQEELGLRILAIASDLENKWGVDPGTLVTQSEAGTFLSIQGEAFFRGAIFGLQSMAPNIFSAVIRALDVEYRTWDTEYAENVTTQWAGTWIETAQAGGEALFETDYGLLSVIIAFVMCSIVLFANVALTGDSWNGFLDVALIGVGAARLGLYALGFLGLVVAICWIYTSAKIWFRIFR